MKKIDVLIFLFVCVLGWLFMPFTFNDAEVRYVAQAYTIENSGSLDIDQYHSLTIDKSFINDHYYPAAPPGLSFVLVPVVALGDFVFDQIPIIKRQALAAKVMPKLEIFQRVAEEVNNPSLTGEFAYQDNLLRFIFILNFVRIVFCVPIGALLAVFVRRLLLYSSNRTSMVGVTFLVLFSTNIFYYIPRVYSHIFASLILVISLLLLIRYKKEDKLGLLLFAGLLIGFFPLIDYPMVITGLILGVSGLFVAKNWSERLLFSLMASLGVAIFMYYHATLFGGPLTLAHKYVVGNLPHKTGFYGTSIPSFHNFYFVLFSLYRGFFWYDFVMVLGIIGLVIAGYKRDTFEKTFGYLILLIWASFLVINASCMECIGAGASWGPRYMIPGAVLLGWGLAPFWYGWRRRVLIAIGVLSTSMQLLALTSPPHLLKLQNPIKEVFNHSLNHGVIPPSIKHIRKVL